MPIASAIKNKILRALGYDTRSTAAKILDTVKGKASGASEWTKERVNPALFPSEEHSFADRVRSANALKIVGAAGLGLGGGYLATHSKESALNNVAEEAFKDELQKIAGYEFKIIKPSGLLDKILGEGKHLNVNRSKGMKAAREYLESKPVSFRELLNATQDIDLKRLARARRPRVDWKEFY